MPQADGTQRALEVLIFPDAMRGAGEGHYPWDLQPKSTMTNGNVEQVVTGVDGETLTVKYKDGDKKITVPPEVPVVTFRYAMRRGLAHAAAKRELVATEQPVDLEAAEYFQTARGVDRIGNSRGGEGVEGSAPPRFRDSRSKDLNALRTKSESSELMDGAAKGCTALLA
jgi:hypothetical protein